MKFLNGYKPYVAFLVVVFLGVFLTNFPFGSYMTGWDNLHPEFNFMLNFKNGIESVWQENQGLGTYGGHGYAATLPHTLFLFVMSFFLPDMYLRSGFTFICLLAGSIGVFGLLRALLKKENEHIKNVSALTAGMFYMLNFATVQNFYIQLESFIIHFALLPWLFYSIIKFFEKSSLKNLAVFFILSLVASAQGFIPPLFIVYMILLSVFLLVYYLNNKSVIALKKASLIFGITILANLYWLLPFIIYSLSNSDVYLSAYNNLSSTENFILKNQNYGNLKDMSILKGFISEAIDTRNGGTFFIFEPWLNHLDTIIVKVVGYLLFAVVLLGLFTAAVKKRIAYRWFIITGFIISFALLATDTFPFNYLTQLMQQVPVLKQAFRVAFTKFSISVSFFYAIAFGLGVFGIISFLNRINKNSLRQYLIGFVTMLIVSSIILFSFPIFRGNLIYDRTRIDIPQSYFELFEFFNEKDADERIANLPQGWNWGWSVYDWGYSGSGFLWYGVKQPIMDRSFDVWGSANESYYWELSKAIYSEDFKSLDSIFKKYNVKWIIFDRNVIPYTNARGYIFRDALEEYLDNSSNYTLEKTFRETDKRSKDIKVYSNKSYDSNSFKVLEGLSNVAPEFTFSQLDSALTDYGNYYFSPENPDAYYPFRKLFSNKNITNLTLKEKNISIEETTSSYIFTAILPEDFVEAEINTKEVEIEDQKSLKSIIKDGNKVSVEILKNSVNSYDSANDKFFTDHKANNCKEEQGNTDNFSQKIVDGSIVFDSQESSNCYAIILNTLPQRIGYLIEVESKNIEGKPLQFAVVNEDSKKVEIEYPLNRSKDLTKSFVFLPEMKYYGLGYSLSFNNESIGEKTTNELKKVSVYPMPFEVISSIKLTKEKVTDLRIFTNDTAYNDNWKAFIVPDDSFLSKKFPFLNGKEITHHFKVNNWANGWDITNLDSSQTERIVTVFMPQYLQYLGIVLAGLPISVFLAYLFSKRTPEGLKFLRKTNSFFEKKAEVFRLKIEDINSKQTKESFPYSINLAEKNFKLEEFATSIS